MGLTQSKDAKLQQIIKYRIHHPSRGDTDKILEGHVKKMFPNDESKLTEYKHYIKIERAKRNKKMWGTGQTNLNRLADTRLNDNGFADWMGDVQSGGGFGARKRRSNRRRRRSSKRSNRRHRRSSRC